jgi:hypothetical protein
MANSVAFTASRNASWRITVGHYSNTAMTTPNDFTGYTARLKIWEHPYEEQPVFDCSATPRITAASPAGGGQWTIDLPAARMAASTIDKREYQIRFTATAGTYTREIFRGTWTPES